MARRLTPDDIRSDSIGLFEFAAAELDAAVALEILNERDQLVLQLRSGLDDGVQYTFKEIGARLSVRPERVRQMQNMALTKLRRHREAERRPTKRAAP